MINNEPEYVKFLGIKIDNIDYDGILKTIARNRNKKGYICLTDTGNVIRASKDKEFCDAINDSLLSIADGTPLAWYAKLIGCRQIKRISGVDLFSRLLKEENGFRHLLLGDTEQTLKKVVNQAKKANENLIITYYSPPFKKRFDSKDNKVMIDIIEKNRSDIVWVSFGGGRQDKWMYHNVDKIRKGIMIGVGAAFKYYTGAIKEPPKIIQYLGFQWLTRLLNNPELFMGYMITIAHYIIYLPIELLRVKLKRKQFANTSKYTNKKV